MWSAPRQCINDIGNAGLKVSVGLFEDDANVFIFGENISDVENQSVHSVSLLNDWLVSNKLSLNLAKTVLYELLY